MQHQSESDKQNLRLNLSALLGTSIINFVETPGSRQPTYVLSTQQGDITIGPTSSLTSQKKCMDRILETTGVVVPVVSRVVWRQCIQGLMLICEKVPVGDASHSAQEIKVETRTWLHDYITDRGRLRSPGELRYTMLRLVIVRIRYGLLLLQSMYSRRYYALRLS